MATKIDWGAWANEAFATGMNILKKQVGGTSTYGGKKYYTGTDNPNPVGGVSGFFSKISFPMIAALGVGAAAIIFLIKRR